MKLTRYEHGGKTHLGALVEDGIISIDDLGSDSMLTLIAGGDEALDRVRKHVEGKRAEIRLEDVRILAPIEQPGKYLGIGLNYAEHAAEAEKLGVSYATSSSSEEPKQTWFNKQTTCLNGPFDDLDPGVTEKLDYEAELGVVIGKTAKNVSAADAADYVFGYFVANDVSARDWQFHSSTITMGKSFDTHGPIGPWITTADEIADPHALSISCHVNGDLRQQSNTSNMVHNIWNQIEYLSTAFTLQPGDLIATGTPEGVGIGMDPQVFLQEGDVVRCEVEGLGVIENRVGRSESA